MIKFNTRHLKGDFFGGLTAGVVALPLALAMGVASGLGPIAGIYGAIFVGFFASLFGGTEPQVSGPTGPMTVVVAGLVASQTELSGNIEFIFTAIILAGILQIIFGFCKLGNYIRLVPYPVVSGFMSGIGALIIILQLNPILGHSSPAGIIDALVYVPVAATSLNITALFIGGLSLFICLQWPATFSKYIPGPLAALIICTTLSIFIGSAPVLGIIPTGLPEVHLPVLSMATAPLIFQAALVLALLGSIDSLLTSLVSDNLTRSRHDSNQELIGQGIGNALAGLFGGTAGAGATMRTMVNIRSGGVTRISGMVHALFLLAVVLGLGAYGGVIPNAALAGILIKVGIDIIDWPYLKKGHRGPRWDLILMLLVFFLTVFVNLISAVIIGVVLAALGYVSQVAKAQMENLKEAHSIRHDATTRELEILEAAGDLLTIFSFSGPLSFGSAAELGHHARTQLEGGSLALILDFSRVPFLDVSAALAVETITTNAEHIGGHVYMCEMSEQVANVLSALDVDQHNRMERHFASREEAMEAALKHIQLSHE